jgi:hypothetical protein
MLVAFQGKGVAGPHDRVDDFNHSRYHRPLHQGQHQLAASAILLLKAKVQIRGLTMMKTNRHFSIIAIKSGLQRL